MKRLKHAITSRKHSIASISKQQSAAIEANAKQLKIALALHQQGQLDQAEVIYKAILQLQPQHFDALQLLATIALQRNNLLEAVALFDRALKINPHHPNALSNRGNALLNMKRPEQALDSYDRALAIKPDFVEALNNRGIALFELKRPEQALNSYDQALAIQADFVQALNNRGTALLALNRPEQALDSYNRVLAISPEFAEALYNRGNALYDLKRPELALDSYERALAIKPDYAEALYNRGNALRALKHTEQALDSYEQALAIKPDYAEALYNCGNTLRDLRRPREALDHYHRVLTLLPSHAEAHWNESLCHLLLGEFSPGWQKFEWRWENEPLINSFRLFERPLWHGKETLLNKTILLHSEQGLGDTLQFCRYIAKVAKLGAKVILEVQPPLKSLLNDLEGLAIILAKGESLPDFDYHCPLLSLPLAFNETLSTISNTSYLKSSRQKMAEWTIKLGKSSKKRVGLVWSGNIAHKNDYNRSIALDTFKGFVNDQADFYCLQKELRPEDQVILEQTGHLKFFGDAIEDFADTAALVELMDLVITIDTSVAHLAGAMGKDVWILLPFNPDWRWLLDRTDSPWYRSAKLFRQPGIGDWESVILDIKTALDHF